MLPVRLLRIVCFASLSLAIGVGLWLGMARTASAGDLPAVEHPVVVELFTSQGCSTCPPADALLLELTMQPGVIALSMHVDYWDYIGWKDPFATPEVTARQQGYVDSMSTRFVYTPQMVVDGRRDVVGTRRAEVMAAIAEAGRAAKPLALSFDPGDGGRVRIPAGTAPDGGASVWLAAFDAQQETEITKGENAGQALRYGNVVRRLVRIGTWTGEALEIALGLDQAGLAGRDGCAVLVQKGTTGPIIGAIKMAMPTP